ncbi:MAG: extracellular solute-binding protein [Candidatus Ornithospirochaeta sp.]|nr:extracellular solute-binding protein [Candidatus Ornithospirochaeta sp.]
MKKAFTLILIVAVALSAVFANGSSESAKAPAQRVVTTVCRASYAGEVWYQEMNAAFEKETGIKVIAQPTPGNDSDHDSKVNIDLLAGGKIDVIPSLGPKYYYDRADAGFFAALDELCAKKGVDAKSIWGNYLPYSEDGHFYAVPYKQEMYCVFYNKNLFDKAGVPYPQGPWTWDEYVETAKKLTNEKEGIYGSYMNSDNPWMIMQAKQSEVPLYKADGTCNFDDPAFAAALQWYKDLGNKYKVQMSVTELLNENVSWNYYAMAGDHMAMFPQGNWFTRLLNSQEDYPKDWNYGVAPLPGAGEGGNNNFVSMGYYSVNKNAEHPEEALEYVLWLGQNSWKYEKQVPALASLSAEEQNQVFSSIADASHGQVTVDDLYQNLMNTGLGTAQSDIIGVAAEEYHKIVIEEAKAFCMDLQDLETTVKKVCDRVNEAIKNAQ